MNRSCSSGPQAHTSFLRVFGPGGLRVGVKFSCAVLLLSVTMSSHVMAAPAKPTAAQGSASELTANRADVVEEVEEERHRMSDAAELDRLIEHYMAGAYEQCTEELAVLLDAKSEEPFTDRGVIERGQIYFASCSLLAGRREPARAALRAALEENPLMPPPDSLTFPPPVVSLFLEVRDEVQQLISRREQEQLLELQRKAEEAEARDRARRVREKELRKMAEEQVVVAQSSRWVASLPFGAGQFQNGNRGLGAFFLVSEVLLGGTVVTSAIILADLEAQRSAGTPAADEFNPTKHAAYVVMTSASWALFGTALLGIGEAHLSYSEERVLEVRRRTLPPHLLSSQPEGDPSSSGVQTSAGAFSKLTVAPALLPAPLGASLGLVGTF